MYIPKAISIAFETHDAAEDYAINMFGIENVVCVNYSKHNNGYIKKLTP